MLYQQEILEAFVADMLELAPDAILLAGDLTYNGERRSHEDLVELLMAIEEEFEVGEINEEDAPLIATVGDAVRYIAGKLN